MIRASGTFIWGEMRAIRSFSINRSEVYFLSSLTRVAPLMRIFIKLNDFEIKVKSFLLGFLLLY